MLVRKKWWLASYFYVKKNLRLINEINGCWLAKILVAECVAHLSLSHIEEDDSISLSVPLISISLTISSLFFCLSRSHLYFSVSLISVFVSLALISWDVGRNIILIWISVAGPVAGEEGGPGCPMIIQHRGGARLLCSSHARGPEWGFSPDLCNTFSSPSYQLQKLAQSRTRKISKKNFQKLFLFWIDRCQHPQLIIVSCSRVIITSFSVVTS